MSNIEISSIGHEAIKTALFYRKERSFCPKSNKQVGAALIASNKHGDEKVFGGGNLEFSTSFTVHAERICLLSAFNAGYRYPMHLFVTTSKINNQSPSAMCCYCRQDYMYVNENLLVTIIDTNGTALLETNLIGSIKYPYRKERANK